MLARTICDTLSAVLEIYSFTVDDSVASASNSGQEITELDSLRLRIAQNTNDASDLGWLPTLVFSGTAVLSSCQVIPSKATSEREI